MHVDGMEVAPGVLDRVGLGVPWRMKKMIERTAAWVLTARCFVGISYGYLIGCRRHFSYGIRIGEVRILSPTPAMIIVGLTASPSVM
jgi:hypothetical protein